MRYLLLLYVSDRPRLGTAEAARAFAPLFAFREECRRRGVLVRSDPLDERPTAVTLRKRSGRLLLTDGPFAETTEWLGGYFLLDCRDRDEALELAALCPTARDGSVEVRPVARSRSPVSGSQPIR